MIGEPVPNSIEAFLDKAEVHIDKGETEEAEKIFRSVLVVFPGNKRALEGMQKIQQREAANPSPKLTPTQDKMHEIIGLYNQGRFEEVLQKAEETARNSVPNIMLFNLIAAANSGLKNFNQAIESFHNILALNPNDAMAYFNIGAVFAEKEDFDAAIKNYHRCLAINPNHAEAHDNIGSALKAQGNLTLAIEQFTHAINLKPNFAQAHFNLGVALQAKGNLSESIKSYEKVCQIKPDYPKVHFNMGNALKDKGEFDAAIDSYKQAIKIKPDYAEAYYNMGIVLLDMGEQDAAIDSYKQAIKVKPDYAEAYLNMGNAMQDKGEFDAAIDSYNQALKIKPDNAEAYYNMGIVLQDKGKLDTAIDSYKKAIKIKPDYTEAHYNLSLIKKYDTVDEQIIQMKSLYTDKKLNSMCRCDICFSLAKAFEDLGNLEEAFDCLKEGNALRKGVLAYNIKTDQSFFDILKKTDFAISKNTFLSIKKTPDIKPIFILGMARSGTTLVEQIISSHSKVTGAGELPLIDQLGKKMATGEQKIDNAGLTSFRENYLNRLTQMADGNPFVTD